MSLWRDASQKDWRYKFIHHGKNYRGRGYPTKAAARIAQEDRRKELRTSPTYSLEALTIPTDLENVVNSYLSQGKRKWASQTYEYKKFVYSSFLNHLALNPSVDKISHLNIISYLETRPTNHNYNVHRKELHCLFKYAVDKLEILDRNPCRKIDELKVDKRAPKIPSVDEIQKLIAAAGRRPEPETPTVKRPRKGRKINRVSPDEKPLILFLVHTLARIDEALRATWEDVNFDQRFIRLWTRKNRDGAYDYELIPINDSLLDLLQALYKSREQEKWVFYNKLTGDRFNHRPRFMKAICKRAGIQHYGFHAIRHFSASYLEQSRKVAKKTISDLLRHKSLSTTEIYLHTIDDAKRDAMNHLTGLDLRGDFRGDLGHKQPTKRVRKGQTVLEIIK